VAPTASGSRPTAAIAATTKSTGTTLNGAAPPKRGTTRPARTAREMVRRM
jgi:hypothetical protein